MSKVFIIPFHVKALKNSIMPQELGGAYVSCYVKSENYVDATERVLKKLAEDGLHPEEILQPINELESSSWSEYLKESWSDYIDNFPDQDGFEQVIETGGIIYSPFASYDPQ